MSEPNQTRDSAAQPAPQRMSRRRVLLGGAVLAAGGAGAAMGVHKLLTLGTTAAGSGPAAPGGTSASANTAPKTPAPPSVPGFSYGPPIGDGSTSQHRDQPHQPHPEALRPGETPPQFVVISWDGAANLQAGLLGRFREVAQRSGASMTLFLSGLYFLPQDQRMQYHPPRRPVGSSDIGFLSRQACHRTIEGIGQAWLEGHEIGTHFNGHFCGTRGVSTWSPADWQQEIEEVMRFVTQWRTLTGFEDLPPLPFDYRKELIGARTPCLEGRAGLLPTAAKLGWRYDSSGVRQQRWPTRMANGLWDTSMPMIPLAHQRPGQPSQIVAMDFNFMANQSHSSPKGDPAMHATWKTQTVDSFLAGFDRAYTTNRAPLIIGNHFEQWNGGIYMDAVEQVMTELARKPGVQLVSMRQLLDWMHAQPPATMAKLQSLAVGQAPAGGWREFLG